MNISELSIRRPVLATVLTIIIIIFGIIGYNTLGVREYPSVDNPIISVSCSYAGANADVIESQITEPLEQNINGIPGIRSISSVSQQGQCRITVEFELSVDLETAANDVRDKVSRAQRFLPRDCDPPTVSKADADATPILMIAIQSGNRSLLELSEIADLTVKEQLQTIPDVSSVQIWGEKRYSMRLWLDPTKLAAHGLTPVDVKNAITQENVELPSGSIEGNTVELTLRTMGQMHTADEFNNIILKKSGGNIIRISDVGHAELGPADLKSYMKMNGVPMVGVAVIPQPGANHIEIADAVYARMEQMKKDLPDDVEYTYGFDSTKFIRASIDEVKSTIYEAFILVIIIIFLFLRDWRVTLVPCIVIPVSLIGAFFVMYIAGFSINVLTMLAIVLSVGLVVDDAIVMTENIYIRIEQGMRPLKAGIDLITHIGNSFRGYCSHCLRSCCKSGELSRSTRAAEVSTWNSIRSNFPRLILHSAISFKTSRMTRILIRLMWPWESAVTWAKRFFSAISFLPSQWCVRSSRYTTANSSRVGTTFSEVEKIAPSMISR